MNVCKNETEVFVMVTPKMRTRILSQMANCEVEEYLERNDIIFIPVGVTEMHGALPMDCEYVMAEAYARLFAEKVDGLVLSDLLYFPAGGTVSGRGTMYMSMQDAVNYLKAIARTLLAQGFRRQIYIPGHGMMHMFIPAMISDFLDETKVPMLFINPSEMFANYGVTERRFNFMDYEKKRDPNASILGAYKICGRMDYLPFSGETNKEGHIQPPGWKMTEFCPWLPDLVKCSTTPLGVDWYFLDQINHGSPALPTTREELEAVADEGAKEYLENVEKMPMQHVVDTLRLLDEFIQNEVLPKHGDHLPKAHWF